MRKIVYLIILILLLTTLSGCDGMFSEEKVQPTITVQPTVSPVPFSFPQSGKVFYQSSEKKVCPFKVETQGTMAYYVKLISLKDNTPIIKFFIRPGDTVELEVPLGRFEMRYAVGSVWYGEIYLFGSNTRYYKADTVLAFTQDTNYVYGHTITLYAVTNGNLDTDPITAEQF